MDYERTREYCKMKCNTNVYNFLRDGKGRTMLVFVESSAPNDFLAENGLRKFRDLWSGWLKAEQISKVLHHEKTTFINSSCT